MSDLFNTIDINTSDANINLKSSNLIMDSLSRKALSILLNESIDPLVYQLIDAIKPIIVNYVISIKQALLDQLEIMPISKASIILSLPNRTIYNWIAKGYIDLYHLSNKNMVSVSQIREVRAKKQYNNLTSKVFETIVPGEFDSMLVSESVKQVASQTSKTSQNSSASI